MREAFIIAGIGLAVAVISVLLPSYIRQGEEISLDSDYWRALDACRAERHITVPDLDSECITIARRESAEAQ
jgi:hypothetical protein